MASQRIAGLITLRINGVGYLAKGKFSYNLGRPKRETVIGTDKVHGFTEKPQQAYIEGEITDRGDLDVAKLVTAEGATVTLELANGKTVVMQQAWYVGDGKVETDEGNIAFRFDAAKGDEF